MMVGVWCLAHLEHTALDLELIIISLRAVKELKKKKKVGGKVFGKNFVEV